MVYQVAKNLLVSFFSLSSVRSARPHADLSSRRGPVPDPGAAEDFTTVLNPNSLEVLSSCRVEPSLANAVAGRRYQFERQGYFCVDPDSTPGALVFNRTVTLKDAWARIERGQKSEV